jgi:FkbM family methyltransferase
MKEYAYLGNQTGVMKLSAVGSVIFNTSDVGMTNILMNDNEGVYEPDVTHMIDATVDKNTVFVDVGANVGIHTIYSGRVMQRAGQILCFEPNPIVFDNLRKNIQINGMSDTAKSHRIALSNNSGKASFSSMENNHRVGALCVEGQENFGKDTYEVDTATLDSYLDTSSSKRHVIKIDVEGTEHLVLEGAHLSLEGIEDLHIIFELNNFERNEMACRALDILSEAGFVFRNYESGSLQRQEADFFRDSVAHFNILASRSL